MATSDLLNEQTALIEESNSLLKLLADRTGQYVWTKRSGKRIALTQTTSSANPTILQVTSDTTDLSKVDASWFVGFKSTYNANSTSYPWEIISETQIVVNTTTTTFAYDPTTAQISIDMNLSGSRTWNGYEENITEEYVIADDEFAYPVNGEQNGYWYVRSRGIDFGSVILTEKANSITVEHCLGIAPAHAVLFVASNLDTAAYTNANIDGYALTYSGGLDYFKEVKSGTTRNESNVTFNAYNSTYQFMAGEYRWAVFAM